MKRFSNQEILAFLRTLDQIVPGPFEVEIIGGTAGILLYGLATMTEDIDTTTSVSVIEGAIEEARKATGLKIPMGVAGLWDGPNDYASRRIFVEIPGVDNLRIYVPERHDWALMKIVRLKDKDREHILQVMKNVGFDPDVFLERFIYEMDTVIGNKAELVHNFSAMMADLFGKDISVRMRSEIKGHEKWKSDLGRRR